MNRTASGWIALSALGLGLIGLGSWHAGASAVPANAEQIRTVAANVAVVNLDQIFQPELDEFSARIKDFQVQLAAWDKDLEDLRARVEAMRDDLETLDLTDDEAKRIAQELLETEALRNAKREIAQRRAVAEEGEIYRAIYAHARETIADIAREEGYDLVLFNDARTPDIADRRLVAPQDVKGAIRSQSVLFSSDSIDITSSLIVRMNNDFAAGRWSE
ncbi:MAG: OmpH family outer membrane protein [Phycisphaerales bacterium JB037]